MFTLQHFIWLIVLGVLIAIALVCCKKYKISNALVGKVVLVLLIVMKLWHIAMSMKESPDGGMVIKQNQLSFHLCAIQLYLVLMIHVIKNEKFVKTIKSFMVPCMMIGGLMSLLLPTEGVSAMVPRVWQYMIIHAGLVFYGIYLMVIEKVDLSLKTYINNIKILTLVSAIAFVMNSILEPYNTNYMYLRKPPMEGLPLLNLNNGWYVYIITLALVACVLIFLVHLPFVLKSKKNMNK